MLRRIMISASIILCIILAVCACGSHTEPAASSADITTASTPVNTDPTTDTTTETTVQGTTEMPVEESSTFSEPTSVEEPSSAPADWDTTDPELMKEQLNNFRNSEEWMHILSFVPSYSGDNARELLVSILDQALYYRFYRYFPEYPYHPSVFEEEDVRWFMYNIFHVSEEGYADALNQFSEKASQAFRYKGDGQLYGGINGGDPSVDVWITIDEATFIDGKWYLEFHWTGDNPVTEFYDRTGSAVMARENIDGTMCWTMYSMQRNWEY